MRARVQKVSALICEQEHIKCRRHASKSTKSVGVNASKSPKSLGVNASKSQKNVGISASKSPNVQW